MNVNYLVEVLRLGAGDEHGETLAQRGQGEQKQDPYS